MNFLGIYMNSLGNLMEISEDRILRFLMNFLEQPMNFLMKNLNKHKGWRTTPRRTPFPDEPRRQGVLARGHMLASGYSVWRSW